MTALTRGAEVLVLIVACLSCEGGRTAQSRGVPVGGDASRGERVILAAGCGACHVIPGVRGAHGVVGPGLAGLRERTFIAGHLANTPDALVRWIMTPRVFEPQTAMPELGLTEHQARDVAAYLYTLD